MIIISADFTCFYMEIGGKRFDVVQQWTWKLEHDQPATMTQCRGVEPTYLCLTGRLRLQGLVSDAGCCFIYIGAVMKWQP